MEWISFHHPKWCPTVIRRRIGEELLDLCGSLVTALEPRSISRFSRSCYPNQSAYVAAMYRLRKAGLIAYRRTAGKMPVLQLTPAGEKRLSVACRRHAPWPARWNGRWYLLSYDVPEKSRAYRNVLRTFLRTMRMGSLHKSVWISPNDIRPEFDDLTRAGGVDEFAHLFESRTVLGRKDRDIVREAWNMDQLRDRQRWYLSVYRRNLDQAEAGSACPEDLRALAREELIAYTTVMENDPFLPRPLWPSEYAGELAWMFHREFPRRLDLLL